MRARDRREGASVSAWLLVIGTVLIAVGVAFVYWPAALIWIGAALVADGAFDLRGEA